MKDTTYRVIERQATKLARAMVYDTLHDLSYSENEQLNLLAQDREHCLERIKEIDHSIAFLLQNKKQIAE